MCVCSTFRSSDVLLFVKNGFVVGVRTLNVTAASATPPVYRCHAWPLCSCHAWLGANNTVQRVKSWTVGGRVAYPGFFSGCPEPPPPVMIFFNQGVTPLLAPTFTSHLNLRLLEPPLRPTLDTSLRYAIREVAGNYR